jgi:hypothetical protein
MEVVAGGDISVAIGRIEGNDRIHAQEPAIVVRGFGIFGWLLDTHFAPRKRTPLFDGSLLLIVM